MKKPKGLFRHVVMAAFSMLLFACDGGGSSGSSESGSGTTDDTAGAPGSGGQADQDEIVDLEVVGFAAPSRFATGDTRGTPYGSMNVVLDVKNNGTARFDGSVRAGIEISQTREFTEASSQGSLVQFFTGESLRLEPGDTGRLEYVISGQRSLPAGDYFIRGKVNRDVRFHRTAESRPVFTGKNLFSPMYGVAEVDYTNNVSEPMSIENIGRISFLDNNEFAPGCTEDSWEYVESIEDVHVVQAGTSIEGRLCFDTSDFVAFDLVVGRRYELNMSRTGVAATLYGPDGEMLVDRSDWTDIYPLLPTITGRHYLIIYPPFGRNWPAYRLSVGEN